jgi:MFS transporter, DHA1 family, multidrug resistance protein
MVDLPPKVKIVLPRFVEFVALIALMMGLTALSIDNLLPAFPHVQARFGIADPNQLQLLVYLYMIGFALMQLVYGPVSDVVGRRPALMVGLAVYAIGCGMAIVASSFGLLLLARVIQGMGAAGARVLAVAIVRDCYAGREMARVLSITFAVFIIVPVFAPAIGGLFLLFGEWRGLFAGMLALALVLAIWFGLQMPETLHPEYRVPFSAKRIVDGIRLTLTSRVTIGYSTAVALIFGCLMTYVGSAQQIFETEVYGLGPLFTVVFGAIAATMAVGAMINARLVRRLGMRRLSHAATLGFVVTAAVQCGLALFYDGRPPLLAFCIALAGNQFFASVAISNFNAMAMEPLGAVAGTASSFLGFYTTMSGALIGLLIGHWFNATVIPLGIGYLVLSVLCLLVVLWTERGVLFRPHHPDPAS